jgi:SAM-dependent methyltransferase
VGSSLEVTEARARQVDAALRAMPEVKHTVTTINSGNAAGKIFGATYVRLVDRDQRTRSANDMSALLREKLAAIPGITVTNLGTTDLGGGKSLQFSIQGSDLKELERLSKIILDQLRVIPGLVDLDSTLKPDKPNDHLEHAALSRRFAHFAPRNLAAVKAIEASLDAGLAGKVDIQMRDYRDITGQFDAIVSIEMFEAVGEKYWPVYFGKLAEVLKPGGKAVLQIITIPQREFEYYRSRPDFIQRYIFPGGMLIPPERIAVEGEKVGLDYVQLRSFGFSYARTLQEWARRFELAWDGIKGPVFDERFRRLWLYYLAYCEAGFDSRRIDVGHFMLTKRP